MTTYFSVLIPFVARFATSWHPTKSVGPFSVLSRGAFETEVEAHAWADRHLEGHPYTVKAVSP